MDAPALGTVSTDRALIAAFRRGHYSAVQVVLGGDVSTSLGRETCAQCGERITDAVLTYTVAGWHVAHPHCVGETVEPEPAPVVETGPALAIDYRKGKAPLRQALVAELQQQDEALGIPGATLRAIARAQIDRARGGDMHAARDIADRLDGRPQAELQLPPGSEMGVQFVIRGPQRLDRGEWLQQAGGKVYDADAAIGSAPLPPVES